MSLSYINSLFIRNTGIPCPDEIENLLINMYIKPHQLFKKINTLLNLSPSMKQIEEWTSEAKVTIKPDLNKKIQTELKLHQPYVCSWNPNLLSPINEDLKGSNGKMLKKGLICEYVNLKIYSYCLNSFKELKKDLIFGRYFHKDKKWIEIKATEHPKYNEIKQEQIDKYNSDLKKSTIQKDFNDLYNYHIQINCALNSIEEVKLLMDRNPSIMKNSCDEYYDEILGSKGLLRSYSRHPIISNTAKRDLDRSRWDDQIAMGDMVKSFMVKDNYEYNFKQGSWVYYIQNEDGTLRRR